MIKDFEVNEPGTINQLCAKTILLKACLEYIDIIHKQSIYSKEAQEQRALVEELREEFE